MADEPKNQEPYQEPHQEPYQDELEGDSETIEPRNTLYPEEGLETGDHGSIELDLESRIQQAKTETTQDNPKIFSIYIKPSCRKRLGIAKKWLGINYTETLDLLICHLVQANILPKEAIKELKDTGLFQNTDKHGLEILGIHGRWAEAAKLVEDVKELNTAINSQVDELLECIEDHAEAIIMNNKL